MSDGDFVFIIDISDFCSSCGLLFIVLVITGQLINRDSQSFANLFLNFD